MRARVLTAEHLDHLVVSPVDKAEVYDVLGRVRTSIGSARLDSGAVEVPSNVAHQLLDPIDDLDLDWTEAAQRYAANRRRAHSIHHRLHDAVEHIKAGGVAVATSTIMDLDDRRTLDSHQVVNVAAMTIKDGLGLCVFDEQGAGKTVTVIFAFDLLAKRQEADLAVILAPKSMVPEWPRDFERFKGDLYKVSVLSGSRREKLDALRRPADVLITNYETAVSLENELAALMRARDDRAILVVDESFYVKNLDARRTRAIRRIREWCGRAFVLCGTPAPNTPEDLIQQFNLVDFGVTFDGLRMPEDKEAKAAIIRDAIESRGLSVRHLKRDVLPDLPEKTFERVLVPLQPKQRRLYEAALKNLIDDLKDVDDATFRKQLASFLARRIALLQLCSDPAMVVEGYNETPAKVLALDVLLADLIESRKEKVVLWSFFRHSIEAISARYAKYGAVRYDGSVASVDDRRSAVKRFQEDDVTWLFVGNPAAAGAGLTLHRSRIAIYESLSNQAAHYLQSLDRIHRRGQTRDVEYLILLADSSIEIAEYETLLRKERAAQDLLGDPTTQPPTRERMLAELLDAAHRLPIGD